MTDELLSHYKQELEHFRLMAPEFSKAHQAIAGRLRMSEEEIDDPHVERLIQAFAFLNARTRRKIEDDFPEISQAMLHVLYPHYLAPLPSAAIVRFALAEDQAEMVQGFSIPKGSVLETEPIDGDPSRFRTCYPVTVWPIRLAKAGVRGLFSPLPAVRWKDRVRSVIRLELTSYGEKAPISAFEFERLRFFLNAPIHLVYQLYETVFNNALGVIVSAGPGDRSAVVLKRDSIRQVGFERSEGLAEYPSRSFPTYQLMTEYFAFPEKFLFFDIVGLDRGALGRFQDARTIHVDICLDRHVEALERYVTAEVFQLGCSPIVNLFRQRAESIRLTHTQTEYRVIPDARRPRAYEVYSIDRVTALSPDNQEIEFSPFYSSSHHRPVSGGGARFWHASRRPAASSDETDDRTEMFLSLVDTEFSPRAESEWTLDVMTTCLNPRRLPFGGGQPGFQIVGGGPLQRVTCLTPPTKTSRPEYGSGALWRLISHLTLNHLSLVSRDGSPDALREILKLYDIADSNETRNMIAGLLSVSSEPAVGRPGGSVLGGVCRGLQVRLHFDEDKFTGRGVYLFGAILERFLGMYCSLNSFTRTVVSTNRREGPLCEWPARAGEMVFL
jgi:type VI secretion system protein ImpG